MLHQKVTLIYFSPTGNTKKIVEAIGSGAGSVSKAYDLTLLRNRNLSLEFGPEDLLVIGVPVYGGRIPELMADWMVHLKGNQTPVIMAVVYGNRDYEDALIELKDLIVDQGFRGLAGAAFVGEHSYTALVGAGRPDAEDLAMAKTFGLKSIEQLEAMLADTDHITVSGNATYKSRGVLPPMAPVTSDACTSCGICAAFCPVSAIDHTDFSKIETDKCIRCCSCIRKCPENAKRFQHESILQITNRLNENFAEIRKSAECFYIE